MDIFADLAGNQLLAGPEAITRIDNLSIHQGDRGLDCNLYLLGRTGLQGTPLATIALPAPYTRIVIAAKWVENLASDDSLFSVTGFASAGAGASLRYKGILNANTTPINDRFPGTAPRDRSIQALVDISFLSEDGAIQETPIKQFPCVITRDMYKGSEGVPVSGSPVYPAPEAIATKASTPLWLPLVAAYTGGAPGALDGVPTVALPAGTLAFFRVPGQGLRAFLLTASTAPTDTTDFSAVRPLDYSASTNAKVWVSVS